MGPGCIKIVDGIEYFIEKDNDGSIYASVKKARRVNKHVVIPSHIDGIPVTEIADSALAKTTDIDEIILPDTITYISSDAFEYSKIKRITIPDGVEYIGTFAFHRCEDLEEINFGKNLGTISNCAFAGCDKLKQINFPKNLRFLTLSAIECCDSLESIHFDGDSFDVLDGDGLGLGYGCSKLKNITTNPANKRYVSIDNVLYDRQKASLIRVPPAYQSHGLIIPSWVKHFENNSFDRVSGLKIVKIQQTEIKNLIESALNPNSLEKVYCQPDSNVKQWADKFGVKTSETISDINIFLDNLENNDRPK